MTTKQELKPGDYVRDILTDEVFELEKHNDDHYSLMVTIVDGFEYKSLTKSGLADIRHKNPRFIKCDPPKEKKAYYQWYDQVFNVVTNGYWNEDGKSPCDSKEKGERFKIRLDHTKVML